MNRQEAEKIKPELFRSYRAGIDNYPVISESILQEFIKWFDRSYPPEPEYIPFEYEDCKEFMFKSVRRKEKKFKNEIWEIVGRLHGRILILTDDNLMEWKSYSSMFEEWEFADGKPFGKLKK